VPYKPIFESSPFRIELEGKLIGDKNNLVTTQDPYLEPSHLVDAIDVSEDGTLTYTGTSNFTAKIDPFKQVQLKEIRLYGDKEIRGSIKNTTVKKGLLTSNKDKRLRFS